MFFELIKAKAVAGVVVDLPLIYIAVEKAKISRINVRLLKGGCGESLSFFSDFLSLIPIDWPYSQSNRKGSLGDATCRSLPDYKVKQRLDLDSGSKWERQHIYLSYITPQNHDHKHSN